MQSTRNNSVTEMDTTKEIEKCILLVANACDGADAQDNIGFNGTDTRFGRSLARQVSRGESLSVKQLTTACKMLQKYRKTQLKNCNLPTIQDLETSLKKVAATTIQERRIGIEGKLIKVEFEYNDEIINLIKSIPNGKYNKSEYGNERWWSFPLSQLEQLCFDLEDYGFYMSRNVLNELEAIRYERMLIESEKAEELKWFKSWFTRNKDNWTFKPFEHQITGFEWMVQKERVILKDQPGLGKTKTALMVLKAYRDYYRETQNEDVKFFIICPVSLKINWLNEARSVDLPIEVFSYAKQPQPLEMFKYIVIVDEFHSYLENDKSKTTQNFYNLTLHKNCLHLYMLSATPMSNGRPKNLYPALKAMKHPLGANKSVFEKRFCNAHLNSWGAWDTTGASNLEELNVKIEDYVLGRKKEDCLDLPPKTHVAITCESNSENDNEYEIALTELKADYHRRVDEGEISNNAQALAFLTFFRKLSSIYKCHHSIKMVEELLDQGEPVVIFTAYLESAHRIANHFGITALDGSVKPADRQKMVDDFQAGLTKVFVGTIQAGGVGITLTKARYSLIHDFTWKPSEVEQTEDRIHRIGQKSENVTIYHMYGKDIDYVLASILQAKNEIIDKVLKKHKVDIGKKDEDGFYVRLLERLIK